jgi:hypothetical protein
LIGGFMIVAAERRAAKSSMRQSSFVSVKGPSVIPSNLTCRRDVAQRIGAQHEAAISVAAVPPIRSLPTSSGTW